MLPVGFDGGEFRRLRQVGRDLRGPIFNRDSTNLFSWLG